jgi:putative Holliday junction resolvase
VSGLPMGGVLALDPGTRHTGIAVADALRASIEPLETFHGPGESEALLATLDALESERTLAAILVGLPLHADGSDSDRCAPIRAFASRLAARYPRLAIVLRDEHLTTKEAEARLHEAGFSGEAMRSRSDSWAAAVILEEWVREGEPLEGRVLAEA